MYPTGPNFSAPSIQWFLRLSGNTFFTHHFMIQKTKFKKKVINKIKSLTVKINRNHTSFFKICYPMLPGTIASSLVGSP